MSTNQTSEEKETFTLERAEEDDEFEEFEKDDWPTGPLSLSASIHWEDNWNSANDNDAFCTQLRAELDKSNSS